MRTPTSSNMTPERLQRIQQTNKIAKKITEQMQKLDIFKNYACTDAVSFSDNIQKGNRDTVLNKRNAWLNDPKNVKRAGTTAPTPQRRKEDTEALLIVLPENYILNRKSIEELTSKYPHNKIYIHTTDRLGYLDKNNEKITTFENTKYKLVFNKDLNKPDVKKMEENIVYLYKSNGNVKAIGKKSNSETFDVVLPELLAKQIIRQPNLIKDLTKKIFDQINLKEPHINQKGKLDIINDELKIKIPDKKPIIRVLKPDELTQISQILGQSRTVNVDVKYDRGLIAENAKNVKDLKAGECHTFALLVADQLLNGILNKEIDNLDIKIVTHKGGATGSHTFLLIGHKGDLNDLSNCIIVDPWLVAMGHTSANGIYTNTKDYPFEKEFLNDLTCVYDSTNDKIFQKELSNKGIIKPAQQTAENVKPTAAEMKSSQPASSKTSALTHQQSSSSGPRVPPMPEPRNRTTTSVTNAQPQYRSSQQNFGNPQPTVTRQTHSSESVVSIPGTSSSLFANHVDLKTKVLDFINKCKERLTFSIMHRAKKNLINELIKQLDSNTKTPEEALKIAVDVFLTPKENVKFNSKTQSYTWTNSTEDISKLPRSGKKAVELLNKESRNLRILLISEKSGVIRINNDLINLIQKCSTERELSKAESKKANVSPRPVRD